MSKEKIRKVDLSGLPRKEGVGANKGKVLIDWKNCVGYEIPFVYDDVEGVLVIVSNKRKKVEFEYNNKIYEKDKIVLMNCGLGNILNKYTSDFRYQIGEVINGLEIINRYNVKQPRKDGRREVRKRYSYKCIKCGNEDTMDEHNLRKGYGCNSCCNSGRRKVIVGYNDITTTAPWMVKYFVNEEDAKKYMKRSDKKARFKCLECGEEKEMSISNMYRDGHFKCPRCGDGFKYPEKFMYSLLKQLEIDFIYQPSKSTFSWCDKYRYDFYIPSLNMIIETHGIQHYEENKNWTMSLEEVQENDKIKEQLAKDNGIEHYIVIDCRYSELEWIKNSILNSKLNEEFDLSKVDWVKCEKFTLKSLVYEVCDYWNNKEEWETTSDLVKAFKISRYTVISYLKRGNKLELVNYDPKNEMIKNSIKNGRINGKRCLICYPNGDIQEFESKAKCIDMTDGLSVNIFNKLVDTNKELNIDISNNLLSSLEGIKIWWYDTYNKTKI